MSPTRNRLGFLPGNTCITAINRGRHNDSCRTETPAMRRGKLAPSRHRRKGKFWGDGYLFEKPCLVIGSAHVSITVIYWSPLALIYRHIWLQLDTRYCRQHLYGQTCKNDIISYQWLKVEQKNACLLWESVENSGAPLRARTFKMPRPWTFSKLFPKPVLYLTHYFSEFYIKADKYFPQFCMNSSFNRTFGFWRLYILLYCFQGPSILTWETLSQRSHVFQRFPLCLASLVMLWRNIQLKWFGRGNIDDI